MSKLTLKLEDLRVQSFETAAGPGLRGTVRGHDDCVGGDSAGCDSVNLCQQSQCHTCGIVIQPFHGGAAAISAPPRNCCV